MTELHQENEARYLRGRRVLEDVEQGRGHSVLDGVREFAPDLERFVVEFGYADVFDRPGLSRSHRQLATIAALAAMGNAPSQLRFHINGARNVGCSTTEIVETLMHISLYAGFPSTLNAISAAREVFATRGDDHVVEPHQTDAENRYSTGWDVLTQVDGEGGHNVIKSLEDLAPDLARFLIEFSFGDIYSRPGLDLKAREIATVAACTALGTAKPQLKVHTHGFLNVGGTREELIEIVMQMAVYAGFPAALNALSVVREALGERD